MSPTKLLTAQRRVGPVRERALEQPVLPLHHRGRPIHRLDQQVIGRGRAVGGPGKFLAQLPDRRPGIVRFPDTDAVHEQHGQLAPGLPSHRTGYIRPVCSPASYTLDAGPTINPSVSPTRPTFLPV